MAALPLALLALAVAPAAIAAQDQAPAWPLHTMQLGLMDPEGDAGALHAAMPLSMRYQYLSGGANTGHGWLTWDGDSFASTYVQESEVAGMTPVLSYYQMRQTLPGANVSDEQQGDLENLSDRTTMSSYYGDFIALLKSVSSAPGPVIIQVEPDLWGYIEQDNANAASVPAAVASSGLPALHGLPDNAAGFAQALLRLRNEYAPHALLAYHLSIWGTGKDIHLSHPTTSEVSQMAQESYSFYASLGAPFNMIFTEYTNRDAGYAQAAEGKGTSAWWNSEDYANMGLFLSTLHRLTPLPLVLWQIPLGNKVMDIMDNTPYHYQDNHVQWLLGPGGRAHLEEYAHDGVVALLFGAGIASDTCACDANHEGVTNYPPIDGNTQRSYSAADDGGYFQAVARRYYAQGPIALPGPAPAHRSSAKRH
jgi:hypothetical protein